MDGMRKLTDVNGHRVDIESVSGRYAYSGMLEGTPYLARKFRVSHSKHVMERPGNYVFGVPELEREIETLDRTCTEWAPREEWHARLSDGFVPLQGTTRVANITWFQEGGDPMRRLQEIVAGLDFLAIAVQVEVDLSE